MSVKSLKRLGAVLCVLGMIFMLSMQFYITAYAKHVDGSLTLICRKDDIILKGMEWRLYRVGSRVNGEYTLEGDFAGYPVSLKDVSAEGMSAAASTLENYVIFDKIKYQKKGKTGKNGLLRFPDLEAGLYMVCGKTLNIGDTFYVPSAILVEIVTNPDGEQENLNIMAYPKLTYRVLSEMDSMYTVRKIWEDDGNTEKRPESIEVEIFKNDEPYDTVILNETNDWTYSWIVSGYAEWRVRETVVPESYTVVYRSNETQYVIVNTYGETTTETTTEPVATTFTETITATQTNTSVTSINTTNTSLTTPKESTTIITTEKLPQTGQLWWPVPILGCGGLIFIAVGLRLSKK